MLHRFVPPKPLNTISPFWHLDLKVDKSPIFQAQQAAIGHGIGTHNAGSIKLKPVKQVIIDWVVAGEWSGKIQANLAQDLEICVCERRKPVFNESVVDKSRVAIEVKSGFLVVCFACSIPDRAIDLEPDRRLVIWRLN